MLSTVAKNYLLKCGRHTTECFSLSSYRHKMKVLNGGPCSHCSLKRERNIRVTRLASKELNLLPSIHRQENLKYIGVICQSVSTSTPQVKTSLDEPKLIPKRRKYFDKSVTSIRVQFFFSEEYTVFILTFLLH